MGIFLSLGHIIPFLRMPQFYELGKNADSSNCGMTNYIPISFRFVWRQLELAFFGAVTSVAALFVFHQKNKFPKGEKENGKKTFMRYRAYACACLRACIMRT